MKLVWKSKVYSKNFVADFGASLKNVIGGRLKTYEDMLNSAIKECSDELTKEYPKLRNIKMQITEFSNSSICVTVYGEVQNYGLE